MDRARRVSTFFIASLLILGGLLYVSNDQTEAGGSSSDKDIGTRAATIPVVPGTEITIEPGKVVNSDYYYPAPLGSTILSANVSFSNMPYTPGGTDYSKEAWFNIGNAPKEYTYGVPGEDMYGYWGRQNQTRTGVDNFDVFLDGVNHAGGKFVLPKNATITSATFNITGYQREDEYQTWYHEGSAVGDMVGHVVRDVGNNYVAMGAPGVSSSRGRFYILAGVGTSISVYTITTGAAILNEFGYSISNPFTVSGSVQNKVAVGAPGYNTSQGYVQIMDVGTSYRPFQRLEGNESGDRFGEAIGAGDIDGDGDDELIIGAPSAESGRGTVFIYHQILNETNVLVFDLLTVINGSSTDTDFGKCIAIGDINADKIEDIVIASNEDVYAYHGGSTLDTIYDTNFDPLSSYPSNTIQNVKFLGALTRSGAESLGIGLPQLTRGAALIHHGGATYDTAADVVFNPPSGATVRNFGYDIDVGYDFNDDGTAEVAIGAPGDQTTMGWTGIYSISTTTATIDFFRTQVNDDFFGSSIAFGTDLLRDGYGDIVVGAPRSMDSLNNNRVGRIVIFERVAVSEIPPNTPAVYVGGSEAWRYGQDHVPAGTTITTGDFSDAINSYLESASPSINSQDEGFVYIDIEMDMVTFSNIYDSNHFLMDSFEIIYEYQRWTGEVADAFNSFMENAPDGAIDRIEGIVKVPFKYGGLTEGGIVIDSVELDVDYIPEIEANLPILHVDEDSHVTDLIDVYQLFEDDYTPDEEMTFLVFPTGENSSRFKTYLTDDRYVSIDMINGTDSANWSGIIEINLIALDVNGGRASIDDIVIEVDPLNDAPAVTQFPDRYMPQNAKMQYLPYARDAEGDNINYSLKEGDHPENMTVDHLGTVKFEPNGWQIGNLTWTLVLDDGEDQREYSFWLVVANENDPPIFATPVPVGLEVLVEETLSIQFHAYDLDPMDIVRYSLPEGPTGSSVGFENGLLTWTPYIYLDGPQKFRVRAIDLEDAYTDLIFFVNVTFIDNPPVLNSTPVTSLTDFVEWTYHLSIIDPDNDIIFVEMIDGPPGMVYDDQYTDSLIWTPAPDQIGSHTISLLINSTTYSMYHNFTLNVIRSERIWNISLDRTLDGEKVTGKKTIGGTASVSPSTIDSIYITIGDDPPIRIPLEGEGWTYTIDTRDYDDGELVIRITASDGVENSTAETLTLMVANDEGGTPLLLIILIIILIVVVLAIAIISFLLFTKMQKKKKEEEEKKMKMEELQKSRQEVDQFIESSDHVEGDTTVFDQVETAEIDHDRAEAIDEVFAPMQPGQVVEGTHLESDDIPEDILQKASMQESVLGQEPPEFTEDIETPEGTPESGEEAIPPPPSIPPSDE